MAANLNPPSHFSQPVVDKERKAPGARLLPPSSFQKRTTPTTTTTSTQPDPWQALAQAKGKIDELQQENKQLRNAKPKEDSGTKDRHSHEHPCSHITRETQPAAPPPAPLPPTQFLHLQHTADILSQQATELAQVRSEVMTLRSQRQREVGALEERLREAEVKYAMETTSLTATGRCLEEEHKAQMAMMRTKHEAETTAKQDQIERLSDESSRMQSRYEQEVSQLRHRLLVSEEDREKTINDLRNDNREKDLTVGSLQSQLGKLRAYIGDTQAASRSTLQWQADSQKQHKKIKDLEKDLDNQRTAVQLLNVRLSSTNEILIIQETELSRVKGESADHGKKLQLLLTRWREKVFELLVQLKSQEIVQENIRREHKWQVTELEEKSTSLESRCHLLEHSIADRDAQLQLERGQSQSLQDELSSVQEVAELLDSRLSGYEETVPQLASLLRSFQVKQKTGEDVLGGLTTRLASYDQRISFAIGRIEILKGLVARKTALWHLREKEIADPPRMDKENITTDADRLPYEQLQTELQQVTRERDALATRIKQDSEAMHEEYNAVRQTFELRRDQDGSRLQELESHLQQRSKDLKGVSSRLERAEAECQASQGTIGRLKTEIAKLQLSNERASADKMVAMETQLTNQLGEMERRLNDARREQAKAVVSLRQLERQTVRERERAAEILKTQEAHLQMEIDRVTRQLREAEKDRNLLMATLKQEGLVSQYKAQRAAVRTLDRDTEQKPANEGAARPEVKGHAGQQVTHKAPLSTILTHLQSLTAQVLEDDDDDDDNDTDADVGNTDKG